MSSDNIVGISFDCSEFPRAIADRCYWSVLDMDFANRNSDKSVRSDEVNVESTNDVDDVVMVVKDVAVAAVDGDGDVLREQYSVRHYY